MPKAGGGEDIDDPEKQTRLIFHLSYDFKRDGLGSVNHFTPPEICTVKYHDLDYAVQVYLRVLNESTPDEEGDTFDLNHHEKLKKRWRDKFEVHRLKCRTVFAGKSDLKSAFRILRLNPASW